jgi:hypothetical protein
MLINPMESMSHGFDELAWVNWELRFIIYFSMLYLKLSWFQRNISTLSGCLILQAIIFVIIYNYIKIIILKEFLSPMESMI